jgi:hypothetical protein
VAALCGVAAAAWSGAWLTQTLFHGYAQSFDAALYARSLWGLAHGDFDNPFLDRPSILIHAHAVLLLLAPLARAFHPLDVLIWAQAASLGALVGQFSWSLGQAWGTLKGGPPWRAALAACWGACLVVPASAWVNNPFWFDVHPDVLGAPWMAAGLLRAVRRGAFDPKAVLWMLPSLLAREDYGLLLACAVWLAPGAGALPRAWRWGASLLGLGWFGGFWALALTWGDPTLSVGAHMGGGGSFAPGDVLVGKLWLFGGGAASVGALHLRGARWWLAALPGLLLLGVSQHMLDAQLRFHYSALVAPAALAAGAAGWRAWLSAQGSRLDWRVAALGGSLVGLAGALWFSSAPTGRWAWGADSQEQAQGMGRRAQEVHERLRALPAEDGVTAPFWCVAPQASRAWVSLPSEVAKRLERGEGVPEGLDTAALERTDWGGLGARLVRQHGFRVLGQRGGVALLTRSPRLAGERLVWGEVPSEVPAPSDGLSCAQGLGGWPQAGLRFGGLRALPDGRAAALVARDAPSAHEIPLALVLVADGPQAPPEELGLMGGMLGPQDLPVGACAAFVTRGPVGARAAGVALVNPATDGALVARSPKGEDVPVLSASPEPSPR